MIDVPHANDNIIKIDIFVIAASGHRYKRQSDESTTKKEESFEQELCKDKDAGEWFRLVAGEGDNCRDVIQCTSSVSNLVVALSSVHQDLDFLFH
jgi:hypothetical protein